MKTHLFVLICCLFAWQSMAQTSNLTLSSPNQELVDGFNWAKNLSLDYVMTGNESTVPMYFAAMGSITTGRACIRDIAHQSIGAHFLGLGTETFTMLKAFSYSTQDEGMNLWPAWDFHYDGHLSRFTRELPTPFEIVECGYRHYLLTGEDRWIYNDSLFTGYQTINNELITMYDSDLNGVADMPEGMGLSSYDEFADEHVYETGVSVGCQWQSYLSYSKILEARGDATGAAEFASKAADIKTHFDNNYWSYVNDNYIFGFHEDRSPIRADIEGAKHLIYKEIAEPGHKAERIISDAHKRAYYGNQNNESMSHYSHSMYEYHDIAKGWHWVMDAMEKKSTYPEVPFSAIQSVVMGLMGVDANAPNNKVYTLSRLNYETPWVQLDHIPIGGNDITVRHDGQTKTTFTNNSGATLSWDAQFYGTYSQLNVGGTLTTATNIIDKGIEISYVTVSIAAGQTIVVETTALPDPGYIFLSDLTWDAITGTARRDVNNNSRILSINDITYQKGIGAGGGSDITYNLNGNYYLLVAELGIDDKSTSSSSTFQVWADGTKIYDSGIINKGDDAADIALEMNGVNQLRLVTSGSGYNNWANAKLTTIPGAYFTFSEVTLTGDDNGDGLLDPGETATLSMNVTNAGVSASGNTTVSCEGWSTNLSYITVNTSPINSGVFASGQTKNFSFDITVNSSTPDKTPIEFTFTATDGTETKTLTEKMITPHPDLDYDYYGLANETVVVNNLLEEGETVDVVLEITNSGTGISGDIIISTAPIGTNSGYVTVNTPTLNIGQLAPGATTQANISVTIAGNTPMGTWLDLEFDLTDGAGNVIKNENFQTTKPIVENTFTSLTNLNNGRPMVDAGQSSEYVVMLNNSGTRPTASSTILNVTATGTNAGLVTVNNPSISIGSITIDGSTSATVNFSVSASAAKSDILELLFTVDDGAYTTTFTKKFSVGEVFISDMPFINEVIGYAIIGRDTKHDGHNPVVIDGVTYDKGIGVHATTEFTINLNGGYSRFLSDIGIANNAGGSIVFEVYTDGTKSFDSGIMLASSATQNIDINVAGVNELRLRVSDGGDGISSDHASWGSPQLTINGNVDNEAPTAPTNLTASNITETSADISWTASTDNIGVTGYKVYMNGNFYQQISSESIVLIGLTANTPYDVYVIARDAIGNVSPASQTINFTTLESSDTEAPTIPTDVSASGISSSSATISWTASTDNVAVTGYDVYVNNAFSETTTATSVILTGLTANSPYDVYVIAKDGAGNISGQSQTINFTTNDIAGDKLWIEAESALGQGTFSPFSVISDPTASGSEYIEVSNGLGNANMDNVTETEGILSFNFDMSGTVSIWLRVYTPNPQDDSYWLKLDNGNYEVQNNLGASSGWQWIKWQDASLVAENHTLTIARREDGTKIDRLLFTTDQSFIPNGLGETIADTEIPSVPENLQVANVGAASAGLTWDASTDNIGVTSYDVYVDGIFNQSVIGTAATVNGLASTTNYIVYVIAKDAAGNESDPSQSVNFITTTQTSDKIWMEAESASNQINFSPFTVVSDQTASADEYIVIPNGSGNQNMDNVTETAGTFTYDFNLSGTVAIWLRVYTPTVEDDSYWLKIDDGTFEKQNDIHASSDWEWRKWKEVSLATGSHTLTLAGREDGTMIDRLLFTSDLTYTPVGEGETVSASGPKALGNSFENGKLSGTLVFPNPSNGKFKIKLPSARKGDLFIMDAAGKIIGQQKIKNQQEIDLDLRHLNTGTYYIRINSDKDAIVKQLFFVE